MNFLNSIFSKISVLDRQNWNESLSIKSVKKDSRRVEPDDLFVACVGPDSDGHDHIAQAIEKGASTVVYQNKPERLPDHVVGVQVEDSYQVFTQLLIDWYRYDDNAIKLIGVTGTNGKTTITQMFYELLLSKFKVGSVGTLSYNLPKESRSSDNTTPGPETLIPLLCDMIKQGAQYASLEVSSHALEQRRLLGLRFSLAVFTQLTQDHLDYHQNMESYFQAKRKLFSEYSCQNMLINSDCEYGKRLLQEFHQAKSFGFNQDADYRAVDVKESLDGCKFNLVFRDQKLPISIQLPLHYNVSNTLAVLAGLDLLGVDLNDYLLTLSKLDFISGRMERVNHPHVHIFIDYAHTPDALRQVLEHVRLQKPKRIISVFGCGGDRDKSKRPLMMRAAAEYSDIVIVTSDNPRSEDPREIMDDIKAGLAKTDEIEIIEQGDRKKAIYQAVELAKKDDVVLIFGKGHEDYQIIGSTKHSFSDRQTVLEALKA